MRSIIALLVCLLSFTALIVLWSQAEATTAQWQPLEAIPLSASERDFVPNAYRVYQLDPQLLQAELRRAPHELGVAARASNTQIVLPLPNGELQAFRVIESPIMADGLAQKYGDFTTYFALGIDEPTAKARLGFTAHGFHAIVFTGQGTVHIEPVSRDTTEQYMSYYAHDIPTDFLQRKYTLEAPPVDAHAAHFDVQASEMMTTGDKLRVYRLAMAANSDYTINQGGTITDGMSAIVTLVNQINAIYERDLAVRLELIAENDQLVFADPMSDPFTSLDLNDIHDTIVSIIGIDNFDVGHLLKGNSGGQASIGSVCSEFRKGKSKSGGFLYDANHEIGHQFGGRHTFNGSDGACTGSSTSSAYEPGGGSTIMSYAIFCDNQNLAGGYNYYMHSHTLDEANTHLGTTTGSSCGSELDLGNAPPLVEAGTMTLTLPAQTPFTLVGSAIDGNGDALLYSWEQNDRGVRGHPSLPLDNSPIFRWFQPVPEPSRTFPRMTDVVNQTQTLGEMLPYYGRELDMRLVAYDNVGGIGYDHMTIVVAQFAGPLRVLSPATDWTVGSAETILWDVANTDQAPINCTTVNIALSTDGGYTYPTDLATNVANDGEQVIVVPDAVGTATRVRVACATHPDHYFFAISPSDFEIVASTSADFSLQIEPSEQAICQPDSAEFAITVAGSPTFNEMVALSASGLPTQTIAFFGQSLITPTLTTQFTISNTQALAAGSYPFAIHAVATMSQTQTAMLHVANGNPITPTLIAPVDRANLVATLPRLAWNGDATAYDVEISADASFTTIIHRVIAYPDTVYDVPLSQRLENGYTYYWRVRAHNPCGNSEFSTPSRFRTYVETFAADTFGGMVLWLDGQDFDGDGLPDENDYFEDIDQWHDKSGNEFDGIGAVDTLLQPELRHDVIFGRTSIWTDGIDDYFTLDPSLALSLTTISEMSLFAITAPDQLSGTVWAASPLSGTQTVSPTIFALGYQNQQLGVLALNEGQGLFSSADFLGSNVPPWSSSAYIVRNNAKWQVDGQTTNSDSNGATFADLSAIDAVTIGQAPDQTAYFNGHIGEIILYDRLLPLGQREQLQGYFAHKWGVNDRLPDTHSYRVTPPDFGINQVPVLTDTAFSVDELSPNGTIVGTINGTDPDLDTLTYTIESGNTDDAFALDPLSGDITVATSDVLLGSLTEPFELTIVATDDGMPPRSTSTLVTITVNDINFVPEINDLSLRLSANAQIGDPVFTLEVNDLDPTDVHTYTIMSGNDGGAFILHPTTGQISVTNNISFTETPTYTLLVRATDNGVGNLWDEATVTINVTNCPAQSIVAVTIDFTECSLRYAIEHVGFGSQVTFAPEIAGATLRLSDTITITQLTIVDGLNANITISGDSDGDGQGDVRLFAHVGSSGIFRNLTLTDGYAENGGGAGFILINRGVVRLENVTMDNHYAPNGEGGAIAGHVNSFVGAENTLFSNNRSWGDGGAIFVGDQGIGHITNSTFVGNESETGAGGALGVDGRLTVGNSTFSANSAELDGGAIRNYGTLSLYNTTIAENSSEAMVGGVDSKGNMEMYNNIVADNGAIECASTSPLLGSAANLIGDGSCMAQLSGNPQLKPLADNGGFAPTHALHHTSPAIDAGDSGICDDEPINDLDQRGVGRTIHGTCDVGAFEYLPTPTQIGVSLLESDEAFRPNPILIVLLLLTTLLTLHHRRALNR